MQMGHPPSSMNRSTMLEPLVLVVEKDSSFPSSLASTLVSHGFRTLRVGADGGALVRRMPQEPDLLLLDAAWTDMDGASLTARWRARTAAAIVVLLEPGAEHLSAEVLDAGADDYLVRPFATAELLARVSVWLRERERARGGERASKGADRIRIRIVRDRRSILVDGREVHLTPIECKLLLVLARSPGGSTSEQQIVTALWGRGSSTRVQHLRAHVRQLRLKIERDPSRPRHLVSEAGGGYRLHLR
jgi:two-component system KDP operon response regulator KdpE